MHNLQNMFRYENNVHIRHSDIVSTLLGFRKYDEISLLHRVGSLALTCSYIKNIKFSKGNFGKHLHRNCINNNNARQDVYA